MTESVVDGTVAVLRVVLSIIFFALLILQVTSKFLQEKYNSKNLNPNAQKVEKNNEKYDAEDKKTGQSSQNYQEIIHSLNDLKTILNPQNGQLLSIFEEIIEIKKILVVVGKMPEQILGTAEGDKQIMLNEFSALTKKIDILGQSIKSTKLPLKSFRDITDQLEALINRKAPEQTTYSLSDSDKQFVENNFSALASQIDTKISNISIENLRVQELTDAFDSKYQGFLRILKEALDVHGYKECVNCYYSVVPKDARYCPNCGQNPDTKTASELT